MCIANLIARFRFLPARGVLELYPVVFAASSASSEISPVR
jgi:hypothetical protein